MRAARKLDMDLARGMPLRLVMNQDTADLIAQLCTRVGMIMEDNADTALTIRAMPSTEWPATLEALEWATHEIGVLLKAARALAAKA